MSREFFIPPDCDDRSIAGEQYDSKSYPKLPRPATNATVRVVPVPEVPPTPEQ